MPHNKELQLTYHAAKTHFGKEARKIAAAYQGRPAGA